MYLALYFSDRDQLTTLSEQLRLGHHVLTSLNIFPRGTTSGAFGFSSLASGGLAGFVGAVLWVIDGTGCVGGRTS